MLSQERLEELILSLQAMYPRNHAPADGRGVYLGPGHTAPVRSQDLLSGLVELRDRRYHAARRE